MTYHLVFSQKLKNLTPLRRRFGRRKMPTLSKIRGKTWKTNSLMCSEEIRRRILKAVIIIILG